MKLRLSVAMSANPRTWPILDGRVRADGIEWVTATVAPSELFWRQLRFGDFDVSEMSMSSLMMVLAKGNRDWIGLPIFTTRRFFHTWVLVRRDAGIERHARLAAEVGATWDEIAGAILLTEPAFGILAAYEALPAARRGWRAGRWLARWRWRSPGAPGCSSTRRPNISFG